MFNYNIEYDKRSAKFPKIKNIMNDNNLKDKVMGVFHTQFTSINRGTNTKEHWEQKHQNEYDIDKDYSFNFMNNPLSYEKIGVDILEANQYSVKNTSILEIGSGNGEFAAYIKTILLPTFDVEAWDFSNKAIEASKKRCPEVNFLCKDILLEPLEKDYGFICCYETIEHINEEINYKLLDHWLDHCEYLILSTVDTVDDCRGEHISHYTINTFDEKGYNVEWKSKLGEINMPDGIYHYIMFLIKGKK